MSKKMQMKWHVLLLINSVFLKILQTVYSWILYTANTKYWLLTDGHKKTFSHSICRTACWCQRLLSHTLLTNCWFQIVMFSIIKMNCQIQIYLLCSSFVFASLLFQVLYWLFWLLLHEDTCVQLLAIECFISSSRVASRMLVALSFSTCLSYFKFVVGYT